MQCSARDAHVVPFETAPEQGAEQPQDGGHRESPQAPAIRGAGAHPDPTVAGGSGTSPVVMLTTAVLSGVTVALPLTLGHEALPDGVWARSWGAALGLAMMTALAGFPLRAAARVLGPRQVPPDSWAEALDRKVSALCVAAFVLMGMVCGGLALVAWLAQREVAVLGLSAAAATFLSTALVTAAQALRR